MYSQVRMPSSHLSDVEILPVLYSLAEICLLPAPFSFLSVGINHSLIGFQSPPLSPASRVPTVAP